MKIKRILKVVDTREYEEGADDKCYPIPGSGIANNCFSCGKLHEIHATVQLENDDVVVVGTGCATKISVEHAPAIKDAESLAKKMAMLRAEQIAYRRKVDLWDQRWAEAMTLLPPSPVWEKEPEPSSRYSVTVGDARVWSYASGLAESYYREERERAATTAWRINRMREKGIPEKELSAPMHRPDLEKRQRQCEKAFADRYIGTMPNVVRSGRVRLYRAQPFPHRVKKSPPSWSDNAPEVINMRDASSRWFTDSLSEAYWYLEHEYPDGEIVFIDIDGDEAEKHRVSRIAAKPGGKNTPANPRAFSLVPELEYFVPREIAALAEPLPRYRKIADLEQWFQASRVCDHLGRPVKLFHGTTSPKDFSIAEMKSFDLGPHFGTLEQANYKAVGTSTPARIIPAYLSLRNPLTCPDAGSWGNPMDCCNALISSGVNIPQHFIEEAEKHASQKRAGVQGDPAYASRWNDSQTLNDQDKVVAEYRDNLRQKASSFMQRMKVFLEGLGFDGIAYRNTNEGHGVSFIAFETWSIRSAVEYADVADEVQSVGVPHPELLHPSSQKPAVVDIDAMDAKLQKAMCWVTQQMSVLDSGYVI